MVLTAVAQGDRAYTAGTVADPVAQRGGGPWLTSVFGLALLVVLPIVIVTGLLSYIASSLQILTPDLLPSS